MQLRKLSEIADVKLGYFLQGALSTNREGNLQVIQPKDIDEFDCIDFSDVWSTTVSPNPEKHFVSDGEVLLISRGKFRATVYRSQPKKNFAVSSSFLRIILKTTEVIPEYTANYLNSSAGRHAVARMHSYGSSIPAINTDELRNVKIPIIPLENQRKIVDFSKEYLRLQKLQKKQNELLSEIFDHLLGEK